MYTVIKETVKSKFCNICNISNQKLCVLLSVLVFPHIFQTPTYAVSVLVEGQRAPPGVQVHSDDGALAKPTGKHHFVPFVLEVT